MAYVFLFTLAFFIILFLNISSALNLETYIVHLATSEGQTLKNSQELENFYTSYLPKSDSSRITHTYKSVISGFAAKLSPIELKELEKKEGVLYARPAEKYELHTTHSPNFLGLYKDVGVWSNENYGRGVIIGLLDTGIVPGHPSFSDNDMPPPPSKWKRGCTFNNIGCNNKLIGAKNFLDDGLPIDERGHGTHTSSTVAGNFVPGANIVGEANGTASGVAPHAHVAMYKVCNQEGCGEEAILAAMDAAIEDGVDILSVSLASSNSSIPFYESSIYIGAFAAAKKGILVSCSAGNSGPSHFTVANGVPWVLTVGASTMDRRIVAIARLGNNEEFEGESLFQLKSAPSKLMPLVNAGVCDPTSIKSIVVRGKIVFCERMIPSSEEGKVIKAAGAIGMILMNSQSYGNTIQLDLYALPTTIVSYAAGVQIKAYINSEPSPTATILFIGTTIGDKTSPSAATFSSRGPNLPSPGILKPDIIGPGVNILAAWNQSMGDPTHEKSAFYVASGTSMACPHLSGVAALIKFAHPLWSPPMIKSAIMTSALQVDLNQNAILDEQALKADVFTIGAGHVHPSKALDPGLVYDISGHDYISYLCTLYNDKQVSIIVNENITCNGSEYERMPEAQLNYPSFAIELGHETHTYSRTVTNVGDPQTMYTVKVEGVYGVDVVVDPKTLSFTKVNQKLEYKVNFSRTYFTTHASYAQGSISWISQKYSVRIPIAVKLPAVKKNEGVHTTHEPHPYCLLIGICTSILLFM